MFARREKGTGGLELLWSRSNGTSNGLEPIMDINKPERCANFPFCFPRAAAGSLQSVVDQLTSRNRLLFLRGHYSMADFAVTPVSVGIQISEDIVARGLKH